METKLITSTRIAEHLSIKPSTLRKYVLLLEEKGYVFLKNDKNQRIYSEKDLTYLRQFKQLIENNSTGGMTLNEAANVVAKRFNAEDNRQDTARYNDVMPSDLESKVDKLIEYIGHQDRFQRELISRLDTQQKYIEEILESRNQEIKAAMQESQEAKRLLLEAKSVVKDSEKKEERGFFAKLFRK